MKSDLDRGPLGAWARQARIAAGYSSADAAAAAAVKTGVTLDAAYLRAIESGVRQPGRDLLYQLGKLYGSTPPAAEPTYSLTETRLRELLEEAADRAVRQVIEELEDRA